MKSPGAALAAIALIGSGLAICPAPAARAATDAACSATPTDTVSTLAGFLAVPAGTAANPRIINVTGWLYPSPTLPVQAHTVVQFDGHPVMGNSSGPAVEISGDDVRLCDVVVTGGTTGISAKLPGTRLTIQGALVSGSSRDGLAAVGSQVVIESGGSASFFNNAGHGISLSAAAKLTSNAVLYTYTNGGAGIQVSGSTATFGNTVNSYANSYAVAALAGGSVQANTCIRGAGNSAGRTLTQGASTIKENCAAGVAVSPVTAKVSAGKTLQLTATVSAGHVASVTGLNSLPGVTWKLTRNQATGTTIDANGKLTVSRNETARTLTVTATTKTSDSYPKAATASARISVTDAIYVKLIKLPQQTLTLVKGKSATMPAKAYTNGTDYYDPLTKLTWKSSKPAVATVNSNGRIAAKAVGTATITATALGKGKNAETMRISFKVRVVAKTIKVKSVAATSMPKQLKVDAKDHIWGVPTPANATGLIATFTTSNKKVLTVGPTGILHARKAGTAKITVTMGSAKRIYTVKVVK
jgi:uncharacterized protein YjdB